MKADIVFAVQLVVGFAVFVILDRAAHPAPAWRRSWRNYSVYVGVWCLGMALELLLFQRPWFGLFNLLGLQLLVIIVSNLKCRYLREPFFYTDTEYFLDAIRHPRLYIPFFGVWNTVLGFALYGASLFLAYRYEVAYSNWGWMALVLALLGAGALCMAGSMRHARLTFEPEDDIRRLGFVPALWRYAQAEKEKPSIPVQAQPFVASWKTPVELPNLLLIQSESFFDPRRYYPELIQAGILSHFDCLASTGKRGVVQVPSWGANTVRTEYAVLSGVEPSFLGVHRFNPYRRLAKHGVATIATYLRSVGYRTVCVHPYAAGFYRRDRAIPEMGFDEFIDITAFDGAERFGAYVSDKALGHKVLQTLQQQHDQPLFVFVITMENHGPLHWETVSQAEREQLLLAPLPEGCDDLAVYARHIQHVDAMLSILTKGLPGLNRPTGLCMYGDHVPIMSAVYQSLGMPDRATDYVMWGTAGIDQQRLSAELTAAGVGPAFLQAMGFRVSGT